jgi:predicted component of type VI protein secretion system
MRREPTLAPTLTMTTCEEMSCAPPSRRLRRGRLTINRSTDRDWLLGDPDCELSRLHCVIERVGDRYTVTDVSANGVFLNGAAEPARPERQRADRGWLQRTVW